MGSPGWLWGGGEGNPFVVLLLKAAGVGDEGAASPRAGVSQGVGFGEVPKPGSPCGSWTRGLLGWTGLLWQE